MKIIRACLLIAALTPPGRAGAEAKPLTMSVYTAPDAGLSFYYPAGWTLSVGENLRAAQNPADPKAPVIEIISFPVPAGTGTGAVIDYTLNSLRAGRPSLAEGGRKKFSASPEGSAVHYFWEEGKARTEAFAFVIVKGGSAIWANIQGTETELAAFNPVLLLQYVLESLAPGPTPNVPSVPPAALNEPAPIAPAVAGGASGEDPATNAFFWNNWRYITPDAFATSIHLW